MLGFVALVPWLRTLDAGRAARSPVRTMVNALAMSVLLTAAMFGWFGLAMARYFDVPGVLGLAVLLVLAPVFQPQVWVFALVRHVVRRRSGTIVGALAGAAAWVATEWAVPKLLGDTLGHGLYPAALLRQAADLGGAAGLTFLLLLANEAVAAAWAAWAASRGPAERARDRTAVRAIAKPLAAAVAVPLALAAYGALSPTAAPEPAAPPHATVRMGLVQSNIVDYERLRRERGAAEVVREVLDVHYAMSHDAVERQKVQALLWSETVYPTTFGRPKSDAGAELDRKIAGIVEAAGVPLVFGTYDRDGEGEYNAAAFLAPGRGLVGVYRKTRLFPFTEALPAWLDTALVRGVLPWAGHWRAGSGARVLPLVLAGGREVPVLPLICLDDVDTGLAVDGARLGAQLIVTMSNDSWFTEHPQGARLHLAVAAFRSVETRLAQFRVTNNGASAVIDARGEVLTGTRVGERTLVVGELPAREPPRTLMVTWGDWVGRAGAVFLLALLAIAGTRAWRQRRRPLVEADAAAVAAASAGAASARASTTTGQSMSVSLLTPAARWLAAGLRALAVAGGFVLVALVLGGEGALGANTLAQIRAFAVWVLAPEAAARALLWASRATLSVQGGALVFAHGARRIELAVADVVAISAWRVPAPLPGVTLHLVSGAHWGHGLARADSVALQAMLQGARANGASATSAAAPALAAPGARNATRATSAASATSAVLAAVPPPPPACAALHAAAFAAPRGSRWLQHGLVKFVALPFLLALPAFRLHQHIAFGGGFGEWQLFGAGAFLKGFALWWAAWSLGVVAVAALVRAVIEAATLAVACVWPARTRPARRLFERLGLALVYLGIPGWLLWRLAVG